MPGGRRALYSTGRMSRRDPEKRSASPFFRSGVVRSGVIRSGVVLGGVLLGVLVLGAGSLLSCDEASRPVARFSRHADQVDLFVSELREKAWRLRDDLLGRSGLDATREFVLDDRLEPARRLEREFRSLSPVYHHDLYPNRSIDGARWGPRLYALRTNSLGFRDERVREVALRSDAHRILFMGDSFTEGIGFDYQDTFVGLIAAELARDGVEVLNAAVASYAPSIYWRKIRYLIEEVGLEFDEVVVFLDISDAQDEAEIYFIDEQERVRAKPPHPDQLAELRRPRRKFGLGRRRGMWTVDEKLFEEYGVPGLERMELLMSQLLELLRSRGIPLTLAVYPWPEQVAQGDLDSIQVRHWREWSAKNEVHFLDYFQEFVKGKSRKQREQALRRFYVPGDIHWNEQGQKRVAARFLEDYRERRSAGAGSAPAERPDVVVITIDTLRADHLSFYGYEAETAPFLAKLARDGARFERAFATSTWTAPSTASIFTGLYPTQHGVTTGFFAQRDRIEQVEREGRSTLTMKRISRDIETLPERFREAGYATYGIAANVNVGPELGFSEGFDHFERLHAMKLMESGTAEQMVEQLNRWAPQLRAGGPNFVYLHFNDVHWPYIGRRPWYAGLLEKLGEPLAASYDSEIAYVDDALERIFERLGWQRDAIVVVLADHGEELGDHGNTGHGMFMYRELLRVPWVVHAPGAGVDSRVIGSNVSQVDLLPTLLDLAGIDSDPNSDLNSDPNSDLGPELPGRSLVPLLRQPAGAPERRALEEELESRALFAHRLKQHKWRSQNLWAVVRGRWKLIDDEGRFELYDTSADPEEQRDLAGERPEVVAELLAELEGLREGATWGAGTRTPIEVQVEVDEESIEALRELGYVE